MTASEQFFRELDRRIESPDSPHDEASKGRLVKARIQLAILAANDPGSFEEVTRHVCEVFGIQLESTQLSTTQDLCPTSQQ